MTKDVYKAIDSLNRWKSRALDAGIGCPSCGGTGRHIGYHRGSRPCPWCMAVGYVDHRTFDQFMAVTSQISAVFYTHTRE